MNTIGPPNVEEDGLPSNLSTCLDILIYTVLAIDTCRWLVNQSLAYCTWYVAYNGDYPVLPLYLACANKDD